MQVICKCMEVLAVGNGSSEILCNSMSLVTKLLTICTEVSHVVLNVNIIHVDNSVIAGV